VGKKKKSSTRRKRRIKSVHQTIMILGRIRMKRTRKGMKVCSVRRKRRIPSVHRNTFPGQIQMKRRQVTSEQKTTRKRANTASTHANTTVISTRSSLQWRIQTITTRHTETWHRKMRRISQWKKVLFPRTRGGSK
jgi:hypothetical protein